MTFDPLDAVVSIFDTSPYILLGWVWGSGRTGDPLWWLIIIVFIFVGSILSMSVKASRLYRTRSIYKFTRSPP